MTETCRLDIWTKSLGQEFSNGSKHNSGFYCCLCMENDFSVWQSNKVLVLISSWVKFSCLLCIIHGNSMFLFPCRVLLQISCSTVSHCVWDKAATGQRNLISIHLHNHHLLDLWHQASYLGALRNYNTHVHTHLPWLTQALILFPWAEIPNKWGVIQDFLIIIPIVLAACHSPYVPVFMFNSLSPLCLICCSSSVC